MLRFIERNLKIFYSFIFDKKYSNKRGYTYNSYKKGPSQFCCVAGFFIFSQWLLISSFRFGYVR